MNKIYYLIDIQPKHQEYSAALNRVRSIKNGLDFWNIESEILLINKKTYKFTFYRWIRAFIYVLRKLSKAKNGDIFIFYGNLPYYLLIPFFKNKLRFVIELNEFPISIIKQDRISLKENKIEKLLINRLYSFNGLITCSNTLSAYYGKYLNKNAKILISPLIVDIEKFSRKYDKCKQAGDYFAYCGRLGNNKDGVPILIDSFALFAKVVDSIKLYIIGNADEKVENDLKARVNSLKMNDRIIFTGALSHAQLIPILQNAQLLLLARPNNKQSEGGIPSKIGEYMAVKVPMVVTRVGELENFLVDSVNCFMAEPDSVEDFKLKMIEAYYASNKEVIVNNALETVKQFDIKNQARLIHEFCEKL